MKILCTICMRGGSKGVPNKNLRNLLGKPLLSYTIEQAKKSQLFEQIVVSSDSEEITKLSKKYGANSWFNRPKKLASDSAPKIPVIRHAFLESERYYKTKFDVLIDLDATSPLRSFDDIRKAYKQFIKDDSEILISGTPSRRSPYFNLVEIIDGRVKKVRDEKDVNRRQDAPKTYDMNASIYIWKRESILSHDTLFTKKTSLYIMPEEKSFDIDSKLDWKIVEFILENKLNE